MKRILAFGASNSSTSINKNFAEWVANEMEGATVTLIDLNDFEMPLYGLDRERETGIPQEAHDFFDLIASHDGLVISLAEYNHNYTTAFKNLMDWTSRVQKEFWQNKPMFLLSCSPGGRGGEHIMSHSLQHMPYMGGNIAAHFSLPAYRYTFDPQKGIVDTKLKAEFKEQFAAFETVLFGEKVGV